MGSKKMLFDKTVIRLPFMNLLHDAKALMSIALLKRFVSYSLTDYVLILLTSTFQLMVSSISEGLDLNNGVGKPIRIMN